LASGQHEFTVVNRKTTTLYNFEISQGSVATVFRWGG